MIVGDLIREAVAHEVSLKISETCYLPIRSFGLEQLVVVVVNWQNVIKG